MKTLAEIGRLFTDEDEARMMQLVDNLDAWMNKYAPTFDDPESILFEVATPLIPEDEPTTFQSIPMP